MKQKPPYFEKMANGSLSIVLADDVNYDTFTPLAQRWVNQLDLEVTDKIEGVDQRQWDCRWKDCKFWLVYDDWMFQPSLEPQDDVAGRGVEEIGHHLMIPKTAEPGTTPNPYSPLAQGAGGC